MNRITLHGYWRSSATYRVRIALALKGISYRQVAYDLRTGEHSDAAYRALAPHGLIPALEHDGEVLIESPAILEWIEARWPEPALLPASPDDAAVVRAMGALVACDIHPLNNLRVLAALQSDFGATDDQVRNWVSLWISTGFHALEQMVKRYGGLFAFGDSPTLADCYIVPQVYNAERYRIDLGDFPRLRDVNAAALKLPAFLAARPEGQPGADR